MENCGMNFIKYLLFVFNLIFAISGVAIIAAGAVVLADVSDFNHFVDSQLLGPPIVLIVAGAIVFVIAFLGCFGAIKESYNMLMAFAGLLIIIFIVELAVGIAAATYKSSFREAIKENLKKSMDNYSEQEHQTAWDNIQKKLMCCGVDSTEDWTSSTQAIPSSCCHSTGELDTDVEQYCVEKGIGKYLYKTGCYEKIQMKIEMNTKILIGVGIGIAFIEIAGIVLACWLAQVIKKEETGK